jgi:hypothetical protein
VQVDIILRRVERTAVVLCVLMSAVALAVTRGRFAAALAVLAGGLLVSISYRLILLGAGVLAAAPGAIQDGVHATPGPAGSDAPPTGASHRRRPLMTGAKVAGRYALLAVLAYVMIARLRLPPVGLLAGASSIVAAVSLEALRYLLKKTP